MKNKKPKTGTNNSPAMMIAMTPTPEQIEKFKNSISFCGSSNGCWEWLGYKIKNGYGQLWTKIEDGTSRMVYTHRLAHVVFNNTQPLEKVVRHMCRNPACCNPAHHKLGTQMDNYNDAVRDGTCGRGEDHRESKLTWSNVREIRRAYKAKEMTQKELGRKFGVSKANIHLIVRNKRWIDENYQP